MSGAGARPAFYALAPGGWRDYATLLHPPYTLWHLSYVAVGAAIAPTMRWGLLGWTVLAFLLAMGIGAHALDELHGRPLGTHIPAGVLVLLAVVSVAAAAAIGLVVAAERTWWLAAFVAAGAFLVVAYNLELWGGAFHSDLWFSLAWGAFPVLTAYFASAGRVRGEAVAAAAFAIAASLAQRTLSTQVRAARRAGGDTAAAFATAASLAQRTLSTQVRAARRAGGDTAAALPAERALELLAVALPLLAGALLLSRSG